MAMKAEIRLHGHPISIEIQVKQDRACVKFRHTQMHNLIELEGVRQRISTFTGIT